MLLKCIKQFGNFKVDDEVEVPDGALFDHKYFEAATQPDDPKDDE